MMRECSLIGSVGDSRLARVERFQAPMTSASNPSSAPAMPALRSIAVRDWPASERPRERLLAHGARALTDAELLAIFLGTGVSGRNVVDLAREALVGFGSLTALFSAPLTEFR